TLTDDDGRFRLADIPVGSTTLTATLAGHEPTATTVPVTPEGAVVELVLAAGGALAGTVSGPDGRVLASALVTVVDGVGEVVATTSSGPDGRFAVPRIPPGSYTVTTSVHVPAAAQVEVGGSGTQSIELRLGAVGPVERRTPVAGD
uniref:carboxypeptidase-like regulatory domain-containing protein n=1 Tax=Pseudonocardia pini TaxID=2758030 RepID=UPI0015EFF0AF